MPKREIYKEIDINGRRWRIGRFDALTGSYISTLLVMQMLPMVLEEQLGLGAMANNRPLMNKQTFMDVQRDCLRVVHELKLVGDNLMPLPVILDDGRWGIGDIEDDAPTVMALTVQVLIFNLSDFFQEDALKTLTGMFPGLIQGTSQFSAKG